MVTVSNAGVDRQSGSLSYIAAENEKGYGHSRNQTGSFFYKTDHAIATQSSNCTLGHLLDRNENLCSHKNININVHNSLFS